MPFHMQNGSILFGGKSERRNPSNFCDDLGFQISSEAAFLTFFMALKHISVVPAQWAGGEIRAAWKDEGCRAGGERRA